MLLTILCLHQVSAEWVEISQQTYHKPLTPLKIANTIHQPFTTTTSITEALLTMTKQSEFLNQSLTDKHWSKGSIIRIPHVGIVQRVHAESTTTVPKRTKFKDRADNPENNGDKLSMKLNLFEQNKVAHENSNDENIESIENIAVNLKNSSRKRNPFISVSHSNESPASDQLLENTSQVDEQRNEMGFVSGDILQESVKLDGPKRNVLNSNTSSYQSANEHRHDFIHESFEATRLPTFQFVTQIESTKDSSEANENVLESDKQINIDREEAQLAQASSAVKKTAPKRKTNTNKLNPGHNDHNTSSNKLNPGHNDHNTSSNKLNPGHNDHNTSSNKEYTSTNTVNPKINTMENVVKVLKIVSNTIAQNTKQSFESKVKYLHNLKNTIMANIESHINWAWPEEARRERRARTPAEPRSHVDFPSSESALMTISFLTFAVFLIKLVLQVIQKYKNTSMMTNAVVATVQRAAGLAGAGPPSPGPPGAPAPDFSYD